MYCDPDTLHAEIIVSQEAKQLTPYVIDSITKMVAGLDSRYHWSQHVELEDLTQEALILVTRKLGNIATHKYDGRKIFNYVTSLIFNHFRCSYRRTKSHNKKLRQYFNKTIVPGTTLHHLTT